MRRYFVPMAAAAVVAFAFVKPTQANQITNLQLYDGTSGAPTATIQYTNADGTGSNTAYVYADPQVSSGTTNPVFYCVDLWHDNYIGSTYTITQVPSMTFANSTFSDVDNRIGWLLSQDQSTPDERAAVQLAIWYTVDNKAGPGASAFTMSTSDPIITNLYDELITFSGYNVSTVYGADFWQATHDPSNTLYQDLVSAPPVTFNVNSVPEPNSLTLSFISVLSLVLFHWWRPHG